MTSAPAGTYWVTPAVLAGPYPSARPTWAQIEGCGITLRIDLTEGEYAISDFHVPTDALMAAILDAIHDGIGTGGRMYVHCAAGVGRTGTVVGCLLAELGEADPLARLKELRLASGLGGDSPETADQARMVSGWVRRTRSDPLTDLDRLIVQSLADAIEAQTTSTRAASLGYPRSTRHSAGAA